MQNKYIILFLFFCFVVQQQHAQLSYPGEITPQNQYPKLHFIDLPPASRPLNAEADAGPGNLKVDISGEVMKLDIDPATSASWQRDKNGRSIWRIGITSPGSSSIGVNFKPFQLNPGVKIFVYTPNQKEILGAYTFRNNKTFNSFTISPLATDSLIIEIQKVSEAISVGELKIESASVGFPKDGYYGWSADCHVDINCTDNDTFQEQKYAVCRLITQVEKTNRIRRCTGTLVNNTKQNGKPYVLTAGHCIKSAYEAHNTVFYFDYESPYCDGPDGEIKSISGSYLLSRTEYLDYSLVELTERPPVDFYPLYAGWDATGDPVESSYSIHHPEGDVKKICVDSNMAKTVDWSPYLAKSFWGIDNYELGSTGDGSSGSALFNQENHLVGVLSGGFAPCSDYIYDTYQKIEAAWEHKENKEEQLKYWLDPKKSGVRKLDRLEPFLGIGEKLTNIKEGTITEVLPSSAGWGYISGHNYLGTTEYAEHFYRNGSKYIYAVNLEVGVLAAISSESQLTLKIWNGTDSPDSLLYEKDLYLFELTQGNDNFIRLDTLVFVNRNFFVGYEINYNSPLDTMALFTAPLNADENKIPALRYNGNSWNLLSDGANEYKVSLAITPFALDYFPPENAEFGEYPFPEVTLYPNPTYDKLQVLFEEQPGEEVIIRVYNLYGHLVHAYRLESPEPNVLLETRNYLNPGLYLLQINFNGKSVVKKLLLAD